MGCPTAFLNQSFTDFDWAMHGVGVPADKGSPSKAMASAIAETSTSQMMAHAGKS